jgi:hypothetical protein
MEGGNTPRNVRQRKDSNFREADAREFERYIIDPDFLAVGLSFLHAQLF